MKPCVFLDRDGVLNVETGDYVFRTDELIIPPGVPEALLLLKQAGFLLVVVTNQAGIAKGLYTAADVEACHQKLQAVCGGIVDALCFCPHHPAYDTESLLRKPDSLMLERAGARLGVDFSRSWMVGDKERDAEAGRKAGTRTIFISTDPNEKSPADYRAENLLEASEIILR